jgi:hypothetical protein
LILFLSNFSTIRHLRLSKANISSFALLEATFPLLASLSLSWVKFNQLKGLSSDHALERLEVRFGGPPFEAPARYYIPSDPASDSGVSADRAFPQRHASNPLKHFALSWVHSMNDAFPPLLERVPMDVKSLLLHGKSKEASRAPFQGDLILGMLFPPSLLIPSTYVL